ncbi:MAG: tRNA uridine-5-carboxymethylaminomethyl(34) synthesis GTPase MnmE [candidate division WOR-3 bacterium]|uniref:tRNA modification GTPase MnmE n=1 Tax=candidate division WOR-3 bacterium TaxID=2052148 RepID=A0A7C2A9N9_UNCW3|nr:tRNA uridine-5-carboxymethylaminomethyl(34) synthesis GTPase MnmE [candidate division WOR-3 bacterium]
MTEDTIVAPATPSGIGGIAVIRISGPDTFALLERLIPGQNFQARPGYTARLCWLRNEKGELIDQVMITVFHAPRSYTGEDMAEISSHGSPLIVDRIIRMCRRLGARLAQPGEFTRRAVLNRKMSISRAEAVAGLVHARNLRALRVAIKAYNGATAELVNRLREPLYQLCAELEYRLGFAEESHPGNPGFNLVTIDRKIQRLIAELDRKIRQAEATNRLFEPVTVAIVGRPNVGKSSLFNCLLQEKRVLTSPIPGTTRDRIEARLDLRGITVRLIDTCGYHPDARNPLTRRGTVETSKAIAEADLVLIVFDRSMPARPLDREILIRIADKPKIPVLNKSDLTPRFQPGKLGLKNPVSVSCKTGENLNLLRRRLHRELMVASATCPVFTQRQIECLTRCRDALRAGIRSENLETRLFEVRTALDALTAIDQPVTSDAILNRIFENFCVGK